MKKIQIQVSDTTHEGLLAEQYKRKIAKSDRTSLAEIAADILEEYLTKQKAVQS